MNYTYTRSTHPAVSVEPRPRVRRDPAGHWRVLVSGMPELTLRYDSWERAMEAALSVARSLRNLLPPPPAPVIPWAPVPPPADPPTQPMRINPHVGPGKGNPHASPGPLAWWEYRRPA